MEGIIVLLALIAGLAIGTLVGWLICRAGSVAALATAEQELKNAREQIVQERGLFDDAKKTLSDTFKALAAQALQQNNEGFLTLAA